MDPKSYITNYDEYNSQVLNKPYSKPSGLQILDPVRKISETLVKDMGVDKTKSERLARIIASNAKAFNIDPRIMIAIIKVESNFDQNAHNTESCKRTKQKICGDFSIAQINYETWSKAFPNMGRKPLDIQKLKTDESYSINRMAEILSILQKSNSDDPLWFSRYHSATPVYKKRYTVQLRKEIKKIAHLNPGILTNFVVAYAP